MGLIYSYMYDTVPLEELIVRTKERFRGKTREQVLIDCCGRCNKDPRFVCKDSKKLRKTFGISEVEKVYICHYPYSDNGKEGFLITSDFVYAVDDRSEPSKLRIELLKNFEDIEWLGYGRLGLLGHLLACVYVACNDITNNSEKEFIRQMFLEIGIVASEMPEVFNNK